MFKQIKTIARDDKGATAVEYGLILALVFLAMLVGIRAFTSGSITMWNNTSTTITTASGS